MRRTAAVITTLLVAVLTLIGMASPADAAPVPAQAACALQASPNLTGGVTSSVQLSFSFSGVNFLVPPAWSYEVSSQATSAVVASKSFPLNNSQQHTLNVSGWHTGSYTAIAHFGNAFPSCSTTFFVQSADGDGNTPDPADLPPIATIDCGPSEVVVGAAISVKGTAQDDNGVSTEKIRFPDGSEKPGNTGTWEAASVGEIAFAYFVSDTDGNQANDLCQVTVASAPETQTETPSDPAPAIAPEASEPATVDTSTAETDTEPEPATVDTSTAETDTEPEPATVDASTAETDTESPDADVAPDTKSATADEGLEALLVEATNDADAELENDVTGQLGDTGDHTDDDAAVIIDQSDTNQGETAESQILASTDATNAAAQAAAAAVADNADDVTTPVAESADTSGLVSVPWWFLILIVTLAAYKPLADLWRKLTRSEAVQAF